MFTQNGRPAQLNGRPEARTQENSLADYHCRRAMLAPTKGEIRSETVGEFHDPNGCDTFSRNTRRDGLRFGDHHTASRDKPARRAVFDAA
ncbi:hypothetical protein [Pararhizobium sp. A13]|uniref:hypothetical protein n=1 Tax=Pararhizobium sp. A13 TaxID=3133975 RepID=UPI0032442284